MIRCAALLVCLAGAASAQEMTSAPGGLIRVLDKLTGVVADFDLARGQSQSLGRLTVLLDECRYPSEDPAAQTSTRFGAIVLSALVAVALWLPTVTVPTDQARLAVANATTRIKP